MGRFSTFWPFTQETIHWPWWNPIWHIKGTDIYECVKFDAAQIDWRGLSVRGGGTCATEWWCSLLVYSSAGLCKKLLNWFPPNLVESWGMGLEEPFQFRCGCRFRVGFRIFFHFLSLCFVRQINNVGYQTTPFFSFIFLPLELDKYVWDWL